MALEAAIIKQTREHQEATDVVEASITVPGQVSLTGWSHFLFICDLIQWNLSLRKRHNNSILRNTDISLCLIGVWIRGVPLYNVLAQKMAWF